MTISFDVLGYNRATKSKPITRYELLAIGVSEKTANKISKRFKYKYTGNIWICPHPYGISYNRQIIDIFTPK